MHITTILFVHCSQFIFIVEFLYAKKEVRAGARLFTSGNFNVVDLLRTKLAATFIWTSEKGEKKWAFAPTVPILCIQISGGSFILHLSSSFVARWLTCISVSQPSPVGTSLTRRFTGERLSNGLLFMFTFSMKMLPKAVKMRVSEDKERKKKQKKKNINEP